MSTPHLSAARRPHLREPNGFSLIELMITIVILAILASIAIPSYQSYILKSHRTEAKTALLDLASMEERYFSTQSNYSSQPSDLGYASTATSFPIYTVSNYYKITQSAFALAAAPTAANPAGTPATYAFTATVYGVQVGDTLCTSLTVDSHGLKTATGTDPNPDVDCWN